MFDAGTRFMIRLMFVTAASLTTFSVSLHAQEIHADDAGQAPLTVEIPGAKQGATVDSATEAMSAPAAESTGNVTLLPAIEVIGIRYPFTDLDALDSGSATRTDTPLIEVPQSVQVLTRRLIEQQDRRTLPDALVNVSGVTPTTPESGWLGQPIVRGFPAEIYLDGMAAYGTAAIADPTSLTGVERIEVVKGPTSTVYGGGAGAPLGGLINVVSERPQSELGGYVALRTGSYETLNPYVDLNVPLTSRVNARIAADYQRNNSWIDNVEGERWSVQPSVLAHLGPQTELWVQGQYSRRNAVEYSGLPAAPALAGQLDRHVFPGATTGQPRTRISNNMETAELRHQFNNTSQLTVTGRHWESTTDQYGSYADPGLYPPSPATPTTYPILAVHLTTRVKESTLDANLLTKNIDALGGRHDLLAGVNFDYTSFDSGVGWNDGVPIGDVDLARPHYTLEYGATPEITITQTDRYRTFAAYVQDQATYGRFHVLGALRLTQFNLRQREGQVDTNYLRLTPRVGATYDLTAGVAGYAGYATGFRGAVSFIGLEPPKPEVSRNYEVGLKLALARIGLSGTIALFDQTRRNVATVDPNNPFHSIQTGEQRSRGLEADLAWQATPALSILANYAYTHAKVTQDTIIPVGDTLPRVPRQSGRIALHYRVTDRPAAGLSFGAGMTVTSSRQVFLPNTVSAPGYAVFDAQVANSFGRYTIALSGVNLTNRRAYDPYQYLSPAVIPIQPRSVYLTLKAKI